MNWFDVFLGLRFNDWWREHLQAKRDLLAVEQKQRDLIKSWEDEHQASLVEFDRINDRAFQILNTEYGDAIKLGLESIRRNDLAGYRAAMADWGRRSGPALERLKQELEAWGVPNLVPAESMTAWVEDKVAAWAALDSLIDAARLWEHLPLRGPGEEDAWRVTEEARDLWKAAELTSGTLDPRPMKLHF
jgi:hypothetical protein